jgi:hypothetical protein
MTAPSQAENVTAQQFSQKLNEFAQGAQTLFAEIPAALERIVRDPYESTAEYQARRTAALEAAQRRERDFFQQNTKTYNVALPVREVRYDPDREIFEFTVDGVGLPTVRSGSSGRSTSAPAIASCRRCRHTTSTGSSSACSFRSSPAARSVGRRRFTPRRSTRSSSVMRRASS